MRKALRGIWLGLKAVLLGLLITTAGIAVALALGAGLALAIALLR